MWLTTSLIFDIPKVLDDENLAQKELSESEEKDLAVGIPEEDDAFSVGPESEDDWAADNETPERRAWWHDDENCVL